MTGVKAPRSLRANIIIAIPDEAADYPARKVTAVAGLIAVASIGGAEAQQATLPAVTVDAPVARPRPAAKPTADQIRARDALRRAAQRQREAAAQPAPFPNAGGLAPPDANPYADAAAPYKVNRLSSGKFSEPIVNTPKSITVLTKELLDDKNATTLREIGRTTAGVTLGSGEGGNAFGDRFFIRGFDARNDIFIDGIRDPAVSIRENFFTEQVEILRGPASAYAGRGTAGGAINIVTKQAADRNFYNAESTFGTDRTRRLTLDVNQVISPTFAMRAGGMFQDAGVAGRDVATDDRWGGFVATRWTPIDNVKITANYVHTDLSSIPDFGVPYYKQGNVPVTEVGVPRETWYGFRYRDFQKAKQDFGTITGEVKVNDNLTLTNRSRAERAVLSYIGTLPQTSATQTSNPDPLRWTLTASPQSRYQVTDVLANQSDATYKFDTGPIRHTAVLGAEFADEKVSIDRYTGLASEAAGSGAFTGLGALANQSIFSPSYTDLPFFASPTLSGNPTRYKVGTKSAYLIETVNYDDLLIVNGGVRYDGYAITSASNTASNATSADLVNYNGGIVYKPVPIGSIYGAYATSSNPFGSELDGTAGDYGGFIPTLSPTQILGPERNKGMEVGTKWELFERHLLVAGALFQTDKTNARETVNGFLQSGAAYRIQGIDLEAGGSITGRWSLFGGLVLMRSKATQTAIAGNEGLQLANIAHQSFSLMTKYKFDGGWELGGQAIYRSRIYGGTFAANTGTELPGYWRFDAFVEKTINENLTMKLYVQNLTNVLYYDTLYRSAAPFVAVGPGRAAYLVATAKF